MLRTGKTGVAVVCMGLIVSSLALAQAQVGELQASQVQLRDDRSQTELVDLNDLEALRSQFNQDEGTPRLFLIVSPT